MLGRGTFQLYRTLNSYVLGGTRVPTTYLLWFDYARIARQLFVARGRRHGMTNPGDRPRPRPATTSPTQLREDVDAASLVGIAPQNIGLTTCADRAPPAEASWFPARSAFVFPRCGPSDRSEAHHDAYARPDTLVLFAVVERDLLARSNVHQRVQLVAQK